MQDQILVEQFQFYYSSNLTQIFTKFLSLFNSIWDIIFKSNSYALSITCNSVSII